MQFNAFDVYVLAKCPRKHAGFILADVRLPPMFRHTDCAIRKQCRLAECIIRLCDKVCALTDPERLAPVDQRLVGDIHMLGKAERDWTAPKEVARATAVSFCRVILEMLILTLCEPPVPG